MRGGLCSAVLALVLLLGGCAHRLPAPAADESRFLPGPTGIAGQVLNHDGSPAGNAFVYAYRSATRGLRGPADFGTRVEADGSYFLDLVEGRYFLVARQRSSGEEAGPPRPGDAWAPHAQNPIEVRAGYATRADLRLSTVTQPLILRQGTLTAGDTGFSGRLVDARGQALPGAVVLAYRSDDFHRMPDLVSPAAAQDGRFTLFLPESGRYCLVARTHPRGQPRAGELYRVIAGEDEGCQRVSRGEVRDLGEVVLQPYQP